MGVTKWRWCYFLEVDFVIQKNILFPFFYWLGSTILIYCEPKYFPCLTQTITIRLNIIIGSTFRTILIHSDCSSKTKNKIKFGTVSNKIIWLFRLNFDVKNIIKLIILSMIDSNQPPLLRIYSACSTLMGLKRRLFGRLALNSLPSSSLTEQKRMSSTRIFLCLKKLMSEFKNQMG